MIPGPIVIRRCSACTGRILQSTTASGNTFGARFWTDGKMHAPMLPDRPLLVKCPYCGALLWIDEQEQVGEIDLWKNWPLPMIRLGPNGQVEEVELGNCDDGIFKDTRSYIAPTPQDYLALLQKGISDNQKERYIRLRVWWAGNDARRQGEDTPLSDDEIANLRAFAAMLDESDENDLIMKAEAMRELGKYEDATVLLSKPFGERKGVKKKSKKKRGQIYLSPKGLLYPRLSPDGHDARL